MGSELVIGIAQMVTGIATLVVAFFLAGQLMLQRRVLERAHQDADRSLSLQSLQMRTEAIFLTLDKEKLSQIHEKRNNTFDSFSEKERDLYSRFLKTQYIRLNTESRLGRGPGSQYFEHACRNILLDCKASRDFYKLNRNYLIESAHFGRTELIEAADNVYEELEGEPAPT